MLDQQSLPPSSQFRDGLLIVPIIGTSDSLRAKQLTDSLHRAIRANRARVVVIVTALDLEEGCARLRGHADDEASRGS